MYPTWCLPRDTMSQDQPNDNSTLPRPPVGANEPKTWERVADGIWRHVPSGIYYERPQIKGMPTYRSLKTRDLNEAQKEFYRRRAQGDAAYEKPDAAKRMAGTLSGSLLACLPDTFFINLAVWETVAVTRASLRA